ncbi:MAG TPA: family 10 glycosylhydrolase, partial [Trichocoleus sp.]
MTKHPSSAWVLAALAALGALSTGLVPLPVWALPSNQGQGQRQADRVLGVAGLGQLGQAIAQLPLAIEPLWAQSGASSAPATLPATAAPGAPSPGSLPSPGPLPRNGPTLDPAEQVAPTVLDLGGHNRPISPVLALAMQQELNNLMGRFESALLMADSATLSTEVSLAAAKSSGSESTGSPALHPALVAARQLQAEWSSLIERGDYAIARQRWQAVRQSLWDNFPTDRPAAQAEIRAIWLDRGTLVAARNPAGLAQVFDRLAAAGVNTVFIETVNAGYPIYPSRVAPYRNPLIQGWDPLKEAVDLAHARGMTAHAWIWTFAAGNERHNTLLRLPLDYPGPLLSLHPDWAGYDNQGNVVPPGQTKPFLDPANQEVRSYLLRLISEIITQYDVDGLQLDYIRYPFQDPGAGRSYGYGTAARWRFRTMTGVDPLQLATWPGPSAPEADRRWHRQMWDRWTEFRVQQVTSFVQEVSLLARRQRPDLILSTAVFARPETERLQKIQQDWGTWARQGYVDWVVLMSYAEDTNRFEQLVKPWLTDPSLSRALIIPGIRLLNLPQPAALDQILAV